MSKLIREREDEGQHAAAVVGPDHFHSLRLAVMGTIFVRPRPRRLRKELRWALPHVFRIEESEAVTPEMIVDAFAWQ